MVYGQGNFFCFTLIAHQERMKDLMKHIKMLKNKMEMFIYFLQKLIVYAFQVWLN